MKIENYILNGLVVAMGCSTFGKDGKTIDYNYMKMLVNEEVIMIRIPQDKVEEIEKLGLQQYQMFDCLVDIKMVSDSEVSSRFIASILYAGQLPFNNKEKTKGDK